jgi:hypothetical protein
MRRGCRRATDVGVSSLPDLERCVGDTPIRQHISQDRGRSAGAQGGAVVAGLDTSVAGLRLAEMQRIDAAQWIVLRV